MLNFLLFLTIDFLYSIVLQPNSEPQYTYSGYAYKKGVQYLQLLPKIDSKLRRKTS